MTLRADDVGDYIEGIVTSHSTLISDLENLTDDQAHQPSLLPGWSVGHVLTHIARNADSVVRRLDAAQRGEVVDQYPGGTESRTAEIIAGAARSAAELREDICTSAHAAVSACLSLPDAAWQGLSRGVTGAEAPAYAVVFGRWREVEVHHVDLGLGYTPDSWPKDMVDLWLPDIVRNLPNRTDPQNLLAWALGRGPAPQLPAWG